MKFSRIVFLPEGQQKCCEACGSPKDGPFELYEYVDENGKKIAVCFECRMYCTTERNVGSFSQRRPSK